jgi:hypothetical protein
MELDWQPNRFFDDTGQWLLCASHGAVYAPDTGEGVAGPCQGGLLKIELTEADGTVRWQPTERLRLQPARHSQSFGPLGSESAQTAMENEVNIDGKPVAWERATIEKLVLAQVREQRAARRWRMLRTLLWMALFGALVWLLARDQWSAATVPDGPHTALVTIRGEIADRSEASAESVLPAMRSALEDSAPRRWCC